jgi:hypothetical protein
MQQNIPRTRWQRWRLALLFGSPLGILELGLIYITITHNYWLPMAHAILIGWFLYLLIPCIAEYRFRSRDQHRGKEENSSTGIRTGLTGWSISVSAATLWLIVTMIVYDMTPPPVEQSVPRNFHAPPALDLIVIIFILLVVYFLSVIGVLLGVGGSLIGEALAAWRAKRLEARV